MGKVSEEGAAPIFGAWYLWDERDSEASCEIWGEQTTFSFFSSFFWLSWVEIEGWFFFFSIITIIATCLGVVAGSCEGEDTGVPIGGAYRGWYP